MVKWRAAHRLDKELRRNSPPENGPELLSNGSGPCGNSANAIARIA